MYSHTSHDEAYETARSSACISAYGLLTVRGAGMPLRRHPLSAFRTCNSSEQAKPQDNGQQHSSAHTHGQPVVPAVREIGLENQFSERGRSALSIDPEEPWRACERQGGGQTSGRWLIVLRGRAGLLRALSGFLSP